MVQFLKAFSLSALELKKGLKPEELLARKGVKPGSKYTFKEIFDALSAELGKRPSIQCMTEEKTQKKILTRINLCFDKRFNLIDCDGVKGGLNQFCPRNAKEIWYPASETHANAAPESVKTGKKGN